MSQAANEWTDGAPSEKDGIAEDDEDRIETRSMEKEISRTAQPAAALMTVEEKAENGISSKVYHAYAKATGSILTAPLVFLLLILGQSTSILSTLWLSWWTERKFHGMTNGIYVSRCAS